MSRLLATFFLLLFCREIRADEPRSRLLFKSSNGQYQLRPLDFEMKKAIHTTEGIFLDGTNTWGVFQLNNKKPLYTLKGRISDKTAYVSNDGKTVVVVDDFSESQPNDTLTVLRFYQTGQQTKLYRLNDLLCSSYNVSESVSHFDWYAKDNFSSSTHRFTLETYELRSIVFDITNGQILSNRRNPEVPKGATFVYGKLHKLGNGKYRIEVCGRIFGQVPADGKILFHSPKTNFWEGDYRTILIKEGQVITLSVRTSDWIINNCSYQEEQELLKTPVNKRLINTARRLGNCP